MRKVFLLIVSLTSFFQSGCSGPKYFTPVSSVRRDPQQQISDSEILKAFQLRPQLVKPVTIALYGGGSSIKGLADSLKKIGNVKDVFEISPGIIEGDSYYRRRGYDWFDDYNQPAAINLSQLRLVAAQGKCDMLIYCGVSYKYNENINYLGYSYVLLLPMFFVPGLNAELVTDVDLFCIDVRNGFLYGTYTDEDVFRENYVTMHFKNRLDSYKKEHTEKIVPHLVDYVKELLARDEIYIKEKTN